MHRFMAAIPTEMYLNVKAEAKRRNMTFISLMRAYIRLGLLVTGPDNEDSRVVIKQGNIEKEIIFI